MVDKKYLPEKASERFVDGKPMICPEELQNPAAVIPAVYLDVNGKGAYSLQHDMIKKVYKRDFSSYIQFGAYSDEFMSKHKEKLFDLFTRLVDDRSRAAMLSFIAQKYDGNYEKTYSDKIQYYDSEILPHPQKNMTFLDCGAYDGDTVFGFIDFLRHNNISSYKKCYALEPDPKNYEKLCSNTKHYENIECLCIGVSDKKDTLFFDEKSTVSSSISDCGSTKIDVDSIDNVLNGAEVSYIKMDIEGAEFSALLGARETILKHRPQIAVCVYHKEDDLVRIPEYLLSLHPDYKLYLRNYAPAGVETVLYAI